MSNRELAFFDAEKVLDYFAILENVLTDTPVRLVAASYNKHPWPWRLQHIGEVAPATFDWGRHRILDSGFKNDDVTNQQMLDGALHYNATEVVAKDYPVTDDRDADEAHAKTTESIREFIDLHDPDTHPPAWIPLQPPYDQHYQTVRPIVEDSHLDHRYMLGGLARREHADRRITELLSLHEVVGDDDVALHGLGWGPNKQLVELLRDDPWLLDGLDNSTPSQCIQYGDALVDADWKKRPYTHVQGDYRGAIGGLFELAMWMQPAQRTTEHSTHDDDGTEPVVHPDQTRLSGVSVDD